MVAIEIKVIELQCKRCGHTWIPRKKEVRLCPSCKTAYWNDPEKRKGSKSKESKSGE